MTVPTRHSKCSVQQFGMEDHAVRQKASLSELPTEILFSICSKVDFRSLLSLGQTCKKFRDVCNDSSMWKQQCKVEYLLTEREEYVESWIEQFRKYHWKFGRSHCPSVYRTMRRLWTRLENYLRENDPDILNSLRDPCDISEILICEERMKHCFPADLRCSLQIHNGQQLLDGIGLLGSMAIASYHKAEGLLDAATMARHYDSRWGEIPGCVPITFCHTSQRCQFIAIDDAGGYKVGEVFYPIFNHCLTEADVDIFITGRTFKDWLEDLVKKLESNVFPRIDNRIFRFEQDPECSATTYNCITVTVGTCFLPEVSTIKPGHFLHVYRITMSMDKDADPDLSCQLQTRHWIITDMDGVEERVDGDGVVGQYPIMKPGATYSWVSCTTFPTTYGSMKGTFTMRNLKTNEEMEIVCPMFQMRCLPYQLSSERKQLLLNRKKTL